MYMFNHCQERCPLQNEIVMNLKKVQNQIYLSKGWPQTKKTNSLKKCFATSLVKIEERDRDRGDDG